MLDEMNAVVTHKAWTCIGVHDLGPRLSSSSPGIPRTPRPLTSRCSIGKQTRVPCQIKTLFLFTVRIKSAIRGFGSFQALRWIAYVAGNGEVVALVL
jgi:hypothetical protein